MELPDIAQLTEQLLTLVWRGARIDHQVGDHDDFSNAVAGVVSVCAEKRDGYDLEKMMEADPDDPSRRRSLVCLPQLPLKGTDMKIRSTDGSLRDEAAGYVLKPGERLVVPMLAMDGADEMQRAIAANSPQALEDARQRAADAYERSRHEMQFEWMGDAGQAPPRPAAEMTVNELTTPVTPPMPRASPT